MLDSSPSVGAEQVIEIASQLKQAVSDLYDAYDLLPGVLEKETRAIKAIDFASVEACRIDKEALGDRIETCFATLTRSAGEIGKVLNQLGEAEAPHPVTLTECVAALDATVEYFPADTFGSQVLRHVQAGLKTLATKFEARYREVKPLVEANRYLCEAMLRNFQESYRFWNEVSEKLAISYNNQGVQKPEGRNSGFRARA